MGTTSTNFGVIAIILSPGEDMVSKLQEHCRLGTMWVMSVSGIISKITVQQDQSIRTYEGAYTILSLSATQKDGEFCPKITFSDPDFGVILGNICGPAIAASTVQIVLGSSTSGEKSNFGLPPGTSSQKSNFRPPPRPPSQSNAPVAHSSASFDENFDRDTQVLQNMLRQQRASREFFAFPQNLDIDLNELTFTELITI